MIESRTVRMILLVLAGLGIWCLTGPSNPARAHEGHLVIPEEEAVTRGRELVDLLVGRDKLSPGWSEAVVESAEMRMVEGFEQWHVIFRNDAETEPARRTLHVFLNYDGQFLGANFSGKTAGGGG